MLSGEFERKLRKLNKELRVCCGDNPATPAGIYHVVRGVYEPICGAPKNWVGKWTTANPNGTLAHSGWRRILRILIQERLVDRRRAEKVFLTHLPYVGIPVKFPDAKRSRELTEKYGWDRDRLKFEVRKAIGRHFTEEEFQRWEADQQRRLLCQ